MKFNAKQLEDFGVDVGGAIARVKGLHDDHHNRYPEGVKKHVALPVDKIVRVAKEALVGVNLQPDLLNSLVDVLSDAVAKEPKPA